MSKIHSLMIRNFRGIENFSQVFHADFVCLIGRGDSGKSTILEAISCVLSANWNLSFFDNDFYNCKTNTNIEIEVTIKDIPEDLLREDKYGLFIRGIGQDDKVNDEIEDGQIPALTIRLEVAKDLEPKWVVITSREIGSKPITATDRAKFNTFLVSDYIDRHFSWNKGSPLYTLLRQDEKSEDMDGTLMIDALRDAKEKIDGGTFSKFDIVIDKVKAAAAIFGINITNTGTTIDFRDIVVKDSKVSLHDDKIPFRLKGKGSKRLISMAIQSAIAETGGIALIDEIEQGLEPDRVQQLVNSLKNHTHGQVFITTHSRDVLVELSIENIYLMNFGSSALTIFPKEMQGTIRRNPEAFFAKRIIVCEGATEIGICRALNKYRVQILKLMNTAYMGVRFADGEGQNLVTYTQAFKEVGFAVCLFCDSDSSTINSQKSILAAKGIEIIDWDNEDCLETAIIRDVPFDLVKEIFELAVIIKSESSSLHPIEEIKENMWSSVKAKFGSTSTCPTSIVEASDSIELRLAIAKASAQKEWFKTIDKGYRLGKLIFDHFDEISDCKLKQQLIGLSNWIERHGS